MNNMSSEVEQRVLPVEVDTRRLMQEVQSESLMAGKRLLAGEVLAGELLAGEVLAGELLAGEEEWREEEPVSSTHR